MKTQSRESKPGGDYSPFAAGGRRIKRRKPQMLLLAAAAFAMTLVSGGKNAWAVPSFARQTGMACSACHVGSFGPQLTQFGRMFKLNGYVWGSAKNPTKGLSAMVFGGYSRVKKDMTATQAGAHGSNNNLVVDQTSLFYAGRLFSHMGVFSQFTYSGADKTSSWDNVDFRAASDTTLHGKDLIYGVTLNNNPTVEDVWQTAPAWRFPYAGTEVTPAPDAAPFITSLGQTVAGLGAYGLWNNLVYAEFSSYWTLGDSFQRAMNMASPGTTDHLKGMAPYWRVALQHDFGNGGYASVGAYGFYAKRYPGNDRTTGKTDYMKDHALDATYQYTKGDHQFSLYGSYIHENQSLDATKALGSSTNASDTLNDFDANASYYYKNTYGVTVEHFSITGSSDALLYPDPSNHKPDSAGWTMQLDYTPFGKDGSRFGPNVNMRLFAQYTAYTKFNGLSHNYDGTGRNASDNNLLYTGIWLAF